MSKAEVNPRGIITNAIGDTLDELPISQVLRVQIEIWEALAAAGYAVVPVEPTAAMQKVGKAAEGDCMTMWTAMIAAAKGEA